MVKEDENQPDASQVEDNTSEDDDSTSQNKNPSEREKELTKALEEEKEKRQKAEDAIVASKKRAKETSDDEPKEKTPATDPFDLARTVSALKDYSTEEIDYIQKYAKMNDLSPQEAAKADDVKDYIGFKREKVAKENNIPDSSSPSAKVYGKDLKDIQKMSKEDHQQLEAEARLKREGREGV